MDADRAEALHGHYLACKELRQAEDAMLDRPSRLDQGGLAGYEAALNEEHAATEEALREGVTLPELDAMAAMAGSRFAPRWTVERFGGGL